MAATVGVRPNIRIEIQNNVTESMDVDNEEKEAEAEVEDGEISDKNDSLETDLLEAATAAAINKALTSTTHLGLIDKTEHAKLSDRATRFGLQPNETNNFPDDEMPKLLRSLGITAANEGSIRFEAIQLRATDNLIYNDIYEYFRSYEPTLVEWISAGCCNVVFHDKATAAKALYFTSKVIKGLPESCENNAFQKSTGKSILLINQEREVELQSDDMVVLSNNDDDSVNASDITVPIPEGCWRLGVEHPDIKLPIFMRFAFKTDKKPFKLEHFDKVTQFAEPPQFGGMLGLISESRRKRIKGIFDRNKEISKKPEDSAKNPWGNLAENWYTNESIEEPPPVPLKAVVKREVLECQKYDVLNRLGTKRKTNDEVNDGSDQENMKKVKLPRMRMYADEEEAKIKRKKRLLAVKMLAIKSNEPMKAVGDLRNIIRTSSKIRNGSEESEHYSDNSDLGKKLKNRLKKRNYRNTHLAEEKTKIIEPALSRKEETRLQTLRSDKQRRDDERRARENDKSIRERERQLDNFRNRSPPPPQKPVENKHEKESSTHKSSTVKHHYDKSRYKNKMHSDKYEERHKRQKRSKSKDHYSSSKTKSKVAVVLKKQKKPVVASTVWSRIESKKERLKTASERLKTARESSTSSESSSESSSSSSSSSSSTNKSSSESSSESEDTNDEVVEQATEAILKTIDRPGFKTSSTQSIPVDHYRKSPLRIEISNDHFRK